MKMSDARCNRCSFWERHRYVDWGDCHRYPPLLKASKWHTNRFPETLPIDWCGEFELMADTEECEHEWILKGSCTHCRCSKCGAVDEEDEAEGMEN